MRLKVWQSNRYVLVSRGQVGGGGGRYRGGGAHMYTPRGEATYPGHYCLKVNLDLVFPQACRNGGGGGGVELDARIRYVY